MQDQENPNSSNLPERAQNVSLPILDQNSSLEQLSLLKDIELARIKSQEKIEMAKTKSQEKIEMAKIKSQEKIKNQEQETTQKKLAHQRANDEHRQKLEQSEEKRRWGRFAAGISLMVGGITFGIVSYPNLNYGSYLFVMNGLALMSSLKPFKVDKFLKIDSKKNSIVK